MSVLEFARVGSCELLGLKGPQAFAWLREQEVPLPEGPNQWTGSDATADDAAHDAAHDPAILVARLGSNEFFIEGRAGGMRLPALERALEGTLPGVYPVLRQDEGFLLSGPGTHDVLAQVCNVNFADLKMDRRPVVMTLMMGVAVLAIPQTLTAWPRCRIWCDPTYGGYVEEALAMVVTQSGGKYLRST